MIRKLKIALLSISSLFLFSIPLTASVAYAADIQGNLCTGADQLTLNTGGNCTLTADTCDFNCVLTKIINILSVIVGVIAVVMIIYGGFRYITSGGTAEKITSAKNTIVYAIIGLIIVALAQVIVRFVLAKTTSA